MAIVTKGNPLTTAVLQYGWTVIADGFGLNTSTTVFKVDYTFDIDAFVVKGSPHPDPTYSYLKLDKWKVSWDSLSTATLTVDYVGIDTAINGGVRTNANTSSANGLTSENISSHPNFFTKDDLFTTGPIAGLSYTQSSLGPLVEIKTPADYAIEILTGKTVIVTKKQSYVGQNGACFESETGGRFIGFVNPTYPNFFGKTNYLAKTSTYSGVIYSTQLTDVQAMMALLNTATDERTWGVFEMLPAWAPIGVGSGGGNTNLLSQVNIEEYGSLYKIIYEIRYSQAGWHSSAYTNI